MRGSVRLGRYDHTRRPYAGPDMLAAQIGERRAELAFLRTVCPQAAASATDIGVGADTDPSPAVTAPPVAEHVSSVMAAEVCLLISLLTVLMSPLVIAWRRPPVLIILRELIRRLMPTPIEEFVLAAARPPTPR